MEHEFCFCIVSVKSWFGGHEDEYVKEIIYYCISMDFPLVIL